MKHFFYNTQSVIQSLLSSSGLPDLILGQSLSLEAASTMLARIEAGVLRPTTGLMLVCLDITFVWTQNYIISIISAHLIHFYLFLISMYLGWLFKVKLNPRSASI